MDPTEDLDCLAGVIEDSTDAVHLGKLGVNFWGWRLFRKRFTCIQSVIQKYSKLFSGEVDPMEQDAPCVDLKWPGMRLRGRT